MKATDSIIVQREEAALACYAVHSKDSSGRKHPEAPHPYRGPFQRDRDRIVHSSAFRRLAHKTQVFTGDMGDYHRTRLTHTLEVSSIARTVGRALRLNEDLVEALALMHDLGHPPFGHAGEDALDECTASEGGFNHNRQALRIVEIVETRYPGFPGLNLTREAIVSQAARDGTGGQGRQGRYLEAQVVDAADSIAYDAHDADDAVELGLLTLEDLQQVELWRMAGRNVREQYGSLDAAQFRRATVHELIDLLASDLLYAAANRLEDLRFAHSAEALQHRDAVVASSHEIEEMKQQLEQFLFQRVYRHPDVLRVRDQAGSALREMFLTIQRRPETLPNQHRWIADRDGLRRATADYLAGMTDRCAWDEHRKLCEGDLSLDWWAPRGMVK